MNIYSIIDKVEYVSFDIFDTLIKRNVRQPEDVFSLVEEVYNDKNKKNIFNFKFYRKLAEKIARRISNKEDVNLNEIYGLLFKKYGNKVDELKLLEIELEMLVCRKNKEVYKIYNYAKSKNKKIIIVSDMYLDRKVIEKILKQNDINDYDRLYVSNELGLTKHTGKLYDYVISDLKCKPSSILHIGDNLIADISQANKRGIITYNIKNEIINMNINKYSKLGKKEINQLNIINSFIKHNIDKDKNQYYKIGYSKLGILFYSFLQWIESHARDNGLEELVFLSRDGFILKKAYDEYFYSKNKINDKYMYVSRRTLIVPSFNENLTFEKMLRILGLTKKDTIESFFLRIGLNANNYRNEIELSGYKVEDKIGINPNNKKLEKLYDRIKDDIIKNALYEREKLKKYIEELNLVNKKVGIIDIGWRGSMQYSLVSILNELNIKIDITGFYVGLTKASEKLRIEGNINAKSYLFDYNRNNDLEFAAFSFIGLLETFFVAPHGSTIGYKVKNYNGLVEPILDKLEYKEENINIIQQVQNGALDFIKDFSEYNSELNIKINERVAFNNILNLGISPSTDELDMFSGLSFSDFKNGYLAKPREMKFYISRPKEFIYDFLSSCWKIAFLKNFFKIKLPYFKIYKGLKRISKN